MDRRAYQPSQDRSMAEDLVQEALMQVYRSWRRRDGGLVALAAAEGSLG